VRLEQTRGLFLSWEQVTAPRDFAQRVLQRLETPDNAVSGGWLRTRAGRLAMSAAAAAVLLVTGVLVHQSQSVPEPATVADYLKGSLDSGVAEVVGLQDSQIPRDLVLNLVLAGGP